MPFFHQDHVSDPPVHTQNETVNLPLRNCVPGLPYSFIKSFISLLRFTHFRKLWIMLCQPPLHLRLDMFNEIQIWWVRRPIKDLYSIVPQPILDNFGCMDWRIILHEDHTWFPDSWQLILHHGQIRLRGVPSLWLFITLYNDKIWPVTILNSTLNHHWDIFAFVVCVNHLFVSLLFWCPPDSDTLCFRASLHRTFIRENNCFPFVCSISSNFSLFMTFSDRF